MVVCFKCGKEILDKSYFFRLGVIFEAKEEVMYFCSKNCLMEFLREYQIVVEVV